jgi:hypothetical protein
VSLHNKCTRALTLDNICRRLRHWRRSAAPASARGTTMTARWPRTRRKRRARRGEKSSRPRWHCPRTPRHAATTLWAKGVCEVKSANSNTSSKRDAGTRVEEWGAPQRTCKVPSGERMMLYLCICSELCVTLTPSHAVSRTQDSRDGSFRQGCITTLGVTLGQG